jgi:hypothetical protein
MMSDLRALRRPPSLFPFLKGILKCCRALRAMRPAWRGGLSQDDATFATPESCMSERRQVKAGPSLRANVGYSRATSRVQVSTSIFTLSFPSPTLTFYYVQSQLPSKNNKVLSRVCVDSNLGPRSTALREQHSCGMAYVAFENLTVQ